MASRSTPTTTTIIGGVDTHKHTHVAAACDHLGRILATASFPTTTPSTPGSPATAPSTPSASKAPAPGAPA